MARKSAKQKSWRRAVPASIPMKDARAQLTSIVDLAERRGEITVLTRNGKPVAMVVPIPGKKPRYQDESP